MSKWIDLDLAERRVVLQTVEDKEKLQRGMQIYTLSGSPAKFRV